MLISGIRGKNSEAVLWCIAKECLKARNSGIGTRNRALRRTEECLLSGNIASSALAPPPLCCSQASGIIVGNLKLERGHILSVRVEHFVVSNEIMYAVFQFCRLALVVLCFMCVIGT